MAERCVPYSSGRHEEQDYADPVTGLALAVIDEAKTDWKFAQRGRVLSAAVGARWRLSDSEHIRLARIIREELEGWFDDPLGLEWWCDVADLDAQAVRETLCLRKALELVEEQG